MTLVLAIFKEIIAKYSNNNAYFDSESG